MHCHIRNKIIAACLAFCLAVSVPVCAVSADDAPRPHTVCVPMTGVLQSEEIQAAWDILPVEPQIRAAAQSLPSSYDGRQQGYLTSVKNQGAANCCWAFSSTAAIEASFVKQGLGTAGSVDFSEAHLSWFGQRQRVNNTSDPTCGDGVYLSDPFAYGGNWQIMASSVFRGSGMQLEKNAPWYYSTDPSTLVSHMTQLESERYTSHARLWSAVGILEPAWKDAWDRVYGTSQTAQRWQQAKTAAIAKTKQSILENGAATLSYFHEIISQNDLYLNKSTAAYYRGVATNSTNHSVVVVGWNDNFSRTNFNAAHRPTVDGAWLVKGSWGTVYGSNGYYWISYAEPSINSIATFRSAKADVYDNIYQYDGSYPSTFWDSNSGGAMANIFEAKQDEFLTHVVFYNTNVLPSDALIEVYVCDASFPRIGPDHNPIKYMQKAENASVTVQDVPYGYSTVRLNADVPLQKGKAFLVMVTFTNDGSEKVWVPVEGVTKSNPEGYDVQYGGEPDQSFLRINNRWFDSSSIVNEDFNNVPIKAMTKNLPESEPQLSVQRAPRRTQYRVGESVNTAGLTLLYVDKHGNQSTVSSGFTVSTQPFAQAGELDVSVKYAGLTCTFTVYVSRTPGDANGDGECDLRDVTLLRRKLAGWEGTDCYDVNLDVNGDGMISLLDVALMTRFLAGGYGVELR